MVRRAAYGVPAAVAAIALIAGAGATGAPGAMASIPIPRLPDPIDLGGTRVDISTDPREPTPLTAGLWADTLSGPGPVEGNAHRFSYTRTMADSSVLVGVVATSPEASNDAVEVTLEAPDATPCGSDTISSPSPARGAVFGVAAVAPSSTYGNRNDPCLAADTIQIKVSRGSADFPSDLPIAIRVVEEGPVLDAEADLPTVQDAPQVTLPKPGDPEPVVGGSTFDGAPEVSTGTYSDAVPEGTERLYRVRLDWGQALAVRVDVAKQDTAAAETFASIADPSVDLTLIDPLRNTFDGGAQDAVQDGSYDDEGATLFDGTLRVAYLNRFGDETPVAPGDYWISLAVSPALDHDPVEVPVELSVEVVGEAGPPPMFRPTVSTPAGDPGPDGYDDDHPYLVDTDNFRADVSGTPEMVDETAAAASGLRRTAGFLVGGLSLVSLAAGVVLLRRRVSRPAATR